MGRCAVPELVLNDLFTQERPDGRTAWLTQPLILLSRTLQGIVIVPAGFLTDYASHPFRTARGEYNRAAVGHDWLYEAQSIVRLPAFDASNSYHDPAPGIYPVTRAEADGAFKEWMEDLGTPGYRREAFHLAVRLGGWLPWHRADRTEHRPYAYGPPALPAEFFGLPAQVWLEALWDYTRVFPRHHLFSA